MLRYVREDCPGGVSMAELVLTGAGESSVYAPVGLTVELKTLLLLLLLACRDAAGDTGNGGTALATAC
jgi:hypothetical protein